MIFFEAVISALVLFGIFVLCIAVFQGRYDGRVSSVVGLYLVLVSGLLLESELLVRSALLQASFIGLLLLSLLLLLVPAVARRQVRQLYFPAVAFFPLMLSVVFFLVNAVMNSNYPDAQVFGRFISIIALFLFIFFCGVSALDLRSAAPAIVAAVLTVIGLSSFGEQVWRSCDRFKCGPFGAIYTGIFPSENALALFCSIAILSVFLLEGKLIRLCCIAPLGLVVFASESRTSQLAIAIALIVWLAVSVVSNRLRSEYSRQNMRSLLLRLVVLATTSIFVVGVVLVNTASFDTFSNRGGIWKRGIAVLGEDWSTGVGMDRWSFFQSIGLLPPLYPHSQYLLLLFGGGVAGLIACLLLLNLAYRRQIRSHSYLGFASGYIAFLSIIGLTEIYWNPSAIDGQVIVLTPLVLMLFAMPGENATEVAEKIDSKHDGRLSKLPARAANRNR